MYRRLPHTVVSMANNRGSLDHNVDVDENDEEDKDDDDLLLSCGDSCCNTTSFFTSSSTTVLFKLDSSVEE
jgi:hypothetical protein